MKRLYASYRTLKITHPETWSRTLSGPVGTLPLLKTPPGPTETQVSGADQYNSIVD